MDGARRLPRAGSVATERSRWPRARRAAAALMLCLAAVAHAQDEPPADRSDIWSDEIDRRINDLGVLFTCADAACTGCDLSCRQCERRWQEAATAAEPLEVTDVTEPVVAPGDSGSLWVSAGPLAPGDTMVLTLRAPQIAADRAVWLRFMDAAVGELLSATRVEPWTAGEAQISVANVHPTESSPITFGLAFVADDTHCADCAACDAASCGADGLGSCAASTLSLPEGTPTPTYTISPLSPPSAEPLIVATTVTSTCDGVSVIPETLVFFQSSWDVPQEVSLLFADDWIHEMPECDIMVMHTVANEDGDYDGLEKSVQITAAVVDRDDAIIYVLPDSLLLREGEAAQTYEVRLSSPPGYHLRRSDPSASSVEPACVSVAFGWEEHVGMVLGGCTSDSCFDHGSRTAAEEACIALGEGCGGILQSGENLDEWQTRAETTPRQSPTGENSWVKYSSGVEERECVEAAEATWAASFSGSSATFSNSVASDQCFGYEPSTEDLILAVCDGSAVQQFQQDSGDAELYCSADDASVCFSVVASFVTVTPQGFDDTVLVSPASLQFSSVNWREPQQVSVAVTQDDYADAQRTITIGHLVTPSVGAPSSDHMTVSVVIDDDDVVQVQASMSEWETRENDERTYSVQLTAQPRGDVAVDLSSASGMRDGSSHHRAARSCAHLLKDFPQLDSGVYWVHPSGAAMPFQVGCDMETEGGGWYALSVESDLLSGGVTVVQRFDANPWRKCSDDAARHYQSLASEDEASPVAVDDSEQFLHTPEYSSAFGGGELAEDQIAAIRNQVTELSSASRIVVSIADDSGYQIFAVDADGNEKDLSPGAPTSCGDSHGNVGNTAFYLWHNTQALSHGNSVTAPISQNFLLPTAVRMVVPASGGGGASFGWEKSVILVRPSPEGCSQAEYPVSCAALKSSGITRNGLYTIDVDSQRGEDPFEVYCDMSTDGGGWTIMYRTGCVVDAADDQNLCAERSQAGTWPQSGLSVAQQRLLGSISTESLVRRSDGTWLKTSSALTTGSDSAVGAMIQIQPVNITSGATVVEGFQAVARDGADFGLYSDAFDGFDDAQEQCEAAYLQRSAASQVFRAGAGLGNWSARGCDTDQEPLAFYIALRGPALPAGCDAHICPRSTCTELSSSRHICHDLSLDLAQQSDVRFDPQVLSFSAATWDVPQMVSVTVADNAVQQAAVEYELNLLHSVVETSSDVPSNSDSGAARTPTFVRVRVTEDDTAGLSISPEVTTTQESCVARESAATWTVSLTSAPVRDVAIVLEAPQGVAVLPALIFVPASTEDFCSDADIRDIRNRLASFREMTTTTVEQVVGVDEYFRRQALTATCPEWRDEATRTDASEGILVVAILLTRVTSLASDIAALFGALSAHLDLLPAQLQFVSLNVEESEIKFMVKPCAAATAWNLPQRVRMTAEDDDVSLGDRQIAVVHTVVTEDPMYAVACESRTFVAAVVDDDEAGLLVLGTPATLVESGHGDFISVTLTAQPSADVVVSLESSGNLQSAERFVIFTTTDYSTAKAFAISAVQNSLNPRDREGTVDILLSMRSNDPAFDGIQTQVSVDVVDDESLLASVVPAAVKTVEGGAASVTVILHTEPRAPVYALFSTQLLRAQSVVASDTWAADDLLQWTGSAELRTTRCSFGSILEISGAEAYVEKEYQFTESMQTQVVVVATIVAVGDWQGYHVVASANGEEQVSEAITVPAGATATCGVQNSATVTIPVEFTVSQPTALSSLVVRFATDIPEGASASFGLAEVSLRTTGQPAPGFCAATALGASISLAGVATPETWRVPIHVHVVAIDDAIFNADRAELVAITLCSEDEHFNFDLPDVAVTVTNDETQSIFTDLQSVTIPEGGEGSYLMWLGSQPSSDVYIQPSISDLVAATFAPAEVVFERSSWNIPQRVVVSTTADSVASERRNANSWVLHTVSSADPGYDGHGFRNLAVRVVDNDSAGILVSNANGTLATPIVLVVLEGAEQTFSVSLQSKPSRSVEVSLLVSDQAGVSVRPQELLFTADSWSSPRTVTLAAARNDAPGRQEATLQLLIKSADPLYDRLAFEPVRIQIIDDDFAGVVADVVSVSEGDAEIDVCFTLETSPLAPVALIGADVVVLAGCLDTLAVNYDERAAQHDASLCHYHHHAAGACGTVTLTNTGVTQIDLAREFTHPVLFISSDETATVGTVKRDVDGCLGWCIHLRNAVGRVATPSSIHWMVLESGTFRAADRCAIHPGLAFCPVVCLCSLFVPMFSGRRITPACQASP